MGDKVKVGVVGSRGYPDKRSVVSLLTSLATGDVEFVSGGARKGVDRWVKEFVRGSDVLSEEDDYEEFLPEFEKDPERDFDVRDYHRRNQKIAEYCDVVFAFQHNNSGGTQSTIDGCKQAGTPVLVFRSGGGDSRNGRRGRRRDGEGGGPDGDKEDV